MTVSIHSMYFLPDFGSAPILINELAGHLAARGHDVDVVTTIPRERPPDLRGLLYSRRAKDGFQVRRFWTNATPHPLGRLLAWNIYTAGTLWNLVNVRPGDVLFLRTPPIQLGWTGFWAKALRGARVLLNVQDIHPDLSIESGILRNPAAIALAKAAEKWVYDVADRIVVISEGFRRNLLDKGVPAAKMDIIPNWVDTDVLRPLPKDNPVARRLGLSDKFVLMYSGTISISSDLALERVLLAADRLRAEKDVLFAIVGEGLRKEAIQARAAALKLDNVVFLPFVPYGDLPALLASADVLLVPLDARKSQLSVPSKLYNFMAAGRPILALAPPDSEVDAVIRTTGGGASVEPADLEAVAATILRLRSGAEERALMGGRARAHVEARFAKPVIMAAYEKIIREMSDHSRSVSD